MGQKNNDRSDLILVYVARTYTIFAILMLFYCWCSITEFGQNNEASVALSVSFLLTIAILSPINTLDLIVLYSLRGFKFVFTKLWFIIFESILYITIISINESLYIAKDILAILLPYVIIIPVTIILKSKLSHNQKKGE